MRDKDLYVGAVVYHASLVNRGKGQVVKKRTTDNLGDYTPLKYRVLWEDGTEYWERCVDLRKVPNQKKLDAFNKAVAIRDKDKEQEDKVLKELEEKYGT